VPGTSEPLYSGVITFGGKMPRKKEKPSLDILCRLANNVKTRRNALDYTQEALGKICLFSKNYISNIEQGTVNITLSNLEKLAKGLRCTESDLLRRETSTGKDDV
jgi:DNA-binding XRE family transcriptional regulator